MSLEKSVKQLQYIGLVLCGTVVIVQFKDAYEVMFGALKLFGRRSSRTDSQVFIQLSGVGRYNLRLEMCCNGKTQFRLSDCSRADKYDKCLNR